MKGNDGGELNVACGCGGMGWGVEDEGERVDNGFLQLHAQPHPSVFLYLRNTLNPTTQRPFVRWLTMRANALETCKNAVFNF